MLMADHLHLADEEDLAGDVDREGPTRRGAIVVARDLRPRSAGVRDPGALEPLRVLVVSGQDDRPEADDVVVAVRALPAA